MWTVNGLASVIGEPATAGVVLVVLIGVAFLFGCMGCLRWAVRYTDRKRLHQAALMESPPLLLVVSHGERTIEGVLRAAWGKSAAMAGRQIIVIDTNGSVETEAIVKLFARDHFGVAYRYVATDEDLAEQLQEARALAGSQRLVYDLRQDFSIRQFGHALTRQTRG